MQSALFPPPSATWADLPVTGSREMWAVFSEDRKYRYVLGRRWTTDERLGSLFVIMLNPSDASETEDDPTVRRCIGFAKREGYGGLVVRNLFAFRTPYVAKLLLAKDPVGPENARVLAYGVDGAVPIAAWGIVPPRLRRLMPKVPVPCSCFGLTLEGWPRHPLYLKADTSIIAWDASRMPGALR